MLRVIAILLLGAAIAHAGQMFRWVDSTGGVHYSDQPPPAAARQVQSLSVKSGTAAVQVGLDPRQSQDTNHVILYATDCGAVCDKAMAYLKQRGIPYTRKDPSKDAEIAQELKKLTGAIEVPVMRVGKTHLKGFDALSWGSLLSTAGYPEPAPATAPTTP